MTSLNRPIAVKAVIQIDDLGPGGRGQIRTNQFIKPTPRSSNLREFDIRRTCGTKGCTAAVFVPVPVKANPHGRLFDPRASDGTHPSCDQRAAGFHGWLPGAIGGLLGNDVLAFDLGNVEACRAARFRVRDRRRATDLQQRPARGTAIGAGRRG